jgi:hypothetical protein
MCTLDWFLIAASTGLVLSCPKKVDAI